MQTIHFHDIQKALFALLCLAAVSFAEGEPVAYTVEDFVKKNARAPKTCVQKGATYKCVGYESATGVIYNTKTKKAYIYTTEDYGEAYYEGLCFDLRVHVHPDGSEIMACDSILYTYGAVCDGLFNSVRVVTYDELGILLEDDIYTGSNPEFCRKSFHYQYGNDKGKPYASKPTGKKKSLSACNLGRGKVNSESTGEYSSSTDKVIDEVKRLQDRIYESVEIDDEPETSTSPHYGVDDGLAGLLGGGGGGVATRAKGSVRTPTERDVKVEGGLPLKNVMNVIRQRTPGLRHIYNKFLNKKPGFSGKVTVKFTVAPNGEVTRISIASSNTKYKDFENEIKSAVSRWKFAKSESGNSTVTVQFAFSE